ncbi:MAG: peptidoglycan bridge formation glycyltransferase FemA/FemB family protein [bacterium]|nr:peptidoglycan bridge formation glycyltransferase FemA/FemB family protein [bacterium]
MDDMYQVITKINPKIYNQLAYHPLQSWEWGEFKNKRGAKVVRMGKMIDGKWHSFFQFFIHKLPLGQKLIYYPRDKMFDKEKIEAVMKAAQKEGAFMAKIEPYAVFNSKNMDVIKEVKNKFNLKRSPHPLFPEYTLRLDLEAGEDVLWQQLHSKARYNVRLAKRKGVVVKEESTKEGVEAFVKLIKKTTGRQGFKAHDESYYFDMYEAFKGLDVLKVLLALYDKKVIGAWVLFDWGDFLFYPYGASDYDYRRLMASNLLAWEAVLYGIRKKKKIFDLWGAAEPGFDKSHKWAGFSRFKLSYGAKYWRTIGSWDLVVNPIKYAAFGVVEKVR